MHNMLRTIEFLGHHISRNEIVSMELVSFHNKMTRKKVIFVTGVTARKRSESEWFAANMQNLVKLWITC